MFNTTTHPQWNYTNLGPNKWATICPRFSVADNYQYQSPINIPLDSLANQHQSMPAITGSSIETNYFQDIFKPVIFNHSLHLLPTSHKQTITFNQITYRLDDIHIHRPSEHTLDKQTFPLEIHLVHRNDFGQATVIAIFVQPNQDGFMPFSNLSQAFKLDATLLLPPLAHYVNYIGSLTTPPTKGPINWIILTTHKSLSTPWLSAFKAIVPIPNTRPLQPTLGRPLNYY